MNKLHAVFVFNSMAIGLLAIGLAGCQPGKTSTSTSTQTLAAAREGFATKLVPPGSTTKEPLEVAPDSLFKTILFRGPVGDLGAYVTPDPKNGKRHPAIIWIAGGECNTLGDVWSEQPMDDDQSAASYRKAGIVMMYPSLRGGNENPGNKEGFLGEVDDILAAAAYLSKLEYVDSNRIYLGGHSTGGTLVLLAAEQTKKFRAVFAFGPVGEISAYDDGSGLLPFDTKNPTELANRSPINWLESITSPVWVFEGATTTKSNVAWFKVFREKTTNSFLHLVEIEGATHFTGLGPTNELIAAKILADTGKTVGLSFTPAEVAANFKRLNP